MPEPAPDPVLQAYAQHRLKFPPELLEQFAGQYVAWHPSGQRIVTSAHDRNELFERIQSAGEDPYQCVVEFIPVGYPVDRANLPPTV